MYVPIDGSVPIVGSDEFLEREEFESMADARAKGSWFRREYNAVRPHSALGYATPKEFSAACSGAVGGPAH
jgi:putative transposase